MEGVWSCAGEVDEDAVSYCERFMELLTDLVAQLPTRRFFNTLMASSHVLVILSVCACEVM